MFSQFRAQYPTASLTSDLLLAEQGHYIVRAVVKMGGDPLSTGLSAAETIELAEDQARLRALTVLGIGNGTYSADVQLLEHETREFPPGAPAQLNPAQHSSVNIPTEFTSDRRELERTDPDWDADWQWSHEDRSESSAEAMDWQAEADLLDLPSEEGPLLPPRKMSVPHRPLSPKTSDPKTPDPKTPDPKRSGQSLGKRVKMPSAQRRVEPVDLSDIIAQTDIELKRLDWTHVKGRQYLEHTYNKRSRQQLTDSELMEFLEYLKSQSNVQDPPF